MHGYLPDLDTFKRLAKEGNLIPVYRELLADTETPVSTLMKLRGKHALFLLESVEGGEKWGRYTFIGADPREIFRVRGDEVRVENGEGVNSFPHGGDPLRLLRELLSRYRPAAVPGLPRFFGGAVGFLGFEMARYFERLPEAATDDLRTDDAVFLITDTLIIFDNVRHTIKAVASAVLEDGADLDAAYRDAMMRIDELVGILSTPVTPEYGHPAARADIPFAANMTPQAYEDMVRRAKDFIVAGDVIQVVLSLRFQRESGMDPVDLYRALRYVNPSPYLFFLKEGDMTLVGSSPEVMVRLEGAVAELKPIAGTRRRGKDEQEDRALADELLEDPKERAEHVMLVDLGRNDLGRIARIGSVQVDQLMVVERYSHVMHLVSHIQAHLAQGKDCFDVLKATFPAGTLSGAPKVRAMEIIAELEPTRRGPYGGAVGYFGYTGNMDFCITIRTIMIKEGKIFIQVGAGIVADSDPAEEYRETMSKMEALRRAIALAASGFELIT